ncbi:MarR family winged helix-turn-helix transcriptional regulator [Psychromarinibacter sp. S121]|uniref:MarR family winged helix-turn-helix transcriptional regulator n=1 Tax=Psychromarinibacter sp. S121 TaxID=3415127 RepID=UPI003C7D79F9
MTEAAAPEAPEDEVSLGHLAKDIFFVMRALRAHLARENASLFERHDVASGEIAIVSLIGLNPGISQKQLAETVVLKKSALTKVVNHLEQTGIIERRKEADDKRFNALHLTERGEALRAAMTPDMLAQQEQVLSALSAAERGMLFELLWRVIDDNRSEAPG